MQLNAPTPQEQTDTKNWNKIEAWWETCDTSQIKPGQTWRSLYEICGQEVILPRSGTGTCWCARYDILNEQDKM